MKHPALIGRGPALRTLIFALLAMAAASAGAEPVLKDQFDAGADIASLLAAPRAILLHSDEREGVERIRAMRNSTRTLAPPPSPPSSRRRPRAAFRNGRPQPTRTGEIPQISEEYSLIVRSLEKTPDRATLRMAIRVHFS